MNDSERLLALERIVRRQGVVNKLLFSTIGVILLAGAAVARTPFCSNVEVVDSAGVPQITLRQDGSATFNGPLTVGGVNIADLNTAVSAIKVKDIKFCMQTATVDTTEDEAAVDIDFPEEVDYVAIHQLGNDANDIVFCHPTKIGPKRFHVTFRNGRGKPNRIIMQVTFLGMKVYR